MNVRKVPLGTFWLGALLALAVGLPLVSFALSLLARVGIGEPRPLMDILEFAAIFAGVPALVSGGGVARLVAHRSVERPGPPGRPLAIGAAAMGVAGIGLAVLTAVPLGGMPLETIRWLPIPAVGLVAGAATGLAIGALAAVRGRRQPDGHEAR